jgi:hypothetical protein
MLPNGLCKTRHTLYWINKADYVTEHVTYLVLETRYQPIANLQSTKKCKIYY